MNKAKNCLQNADWTKQVNGVFVETALPMAAYGIKFLAKSFGDLTMSKLLFINSSIFKRLSEYKNFLLERRNLALTQPGVASGEEVDSQLVNEDNPPDPNYLFGEEVSL